MSSLKYAKKILKRAAPFKEVITAIREGFWGRPIYIHSRTALPVLASPLTSPSCILKFPSPSCIICRIRI